MNRNTPTDSEGSDLNITPDDARAILAELAGDKSLHTAGDDKKSGHMGTRFELGPPVPSRPLLPDASPASIDMIWTLIEAIPDALVIVDRDGRVAAVNHQAEQMFRYARAEVVGQEVEFLLPERFRADHVRRRESYLANPRPRPMGSGLDLFGRRSDGLEFPVEISLNALPSPTGLFVIAAIRDVTERKVAEEKVRRAERRFRTLVEGIPAICFIASLDEDSNEMYVSPQIEKVLGFTQKEWLEDPVLWYSRLHPDDKNRWQADFVRTCSMAADFRSDYRFLSRDNKVVWIHGEAKIVFDDFGKPLFLHGIAFDITQLKEAEEISRRSHEQLEQSVRDRTVQLSEEIQQRQVTQEKLEKILKEREALLKEIHHRVKNNLQITSSLLNLQSLHVTDPTALEILQESRNRVRLIALLHEKLYGSEDLARIDFHRYVGELITYLFRGYSISASRIRLELRMAEVYFDIDTAIPCGLIINELVTNSLKYAFPEGRAGTICISLTVDVDGWHTLEVSDDGAGFPPGFAFEESSSLGLQLVRTMAQQLGGNATLRTSDSTDAADSRRGGVQVRFPAPTRRR